jgi:cystathionine beta-lyase/cystathionine gamma-synthase
MDKVYKRLGIDFTFVDMTKLDAVKEAFRSTTKLEWVETPTNPMLKLIDIEAVSSLARDKGVPVVVDNTFATPALQSPLALGSTMVLHSTTKYLGGHSDVVGGAVITSDTAWRDRVAFVQNSAGRTPGPFDCVLTLRGTKTLHVRMDRHVENAIAIADMLTGNPHVEKVIFPGLTSHPQHALAKKQMKGPGGMISFVVKGGLEKASRVLKNHSRRGRGRPRH